MFNPESEVKIYLCRHERKKADRHQISPLMNILSWEEGGKHFAHCLELDIVAEGEDEQAALKSLAELLVRQVEFAEENKIEIFHPAPPEYWQKLYELHSNRVKQYLLENPPRSAKELLEGLEPAYA